MKKTKDHGYIAKLVQRLNGGQYYDFCETLFSTQGRQLKITDFDILLLHK